MRKLLALILIALFIPMSPASAETPAPVTFLKPLNLQSINAPVIDNGFSQYTFSVMALNIYNNVNVMYFELIDCNNLGQDMKRIWWNSFYPSNGDIDARGKTVVVKDLTFSGVSWSKTGVGVCNGNWKMKVTVSMINNSISQDIVTITEIPTIYLAPVINTPWIQTHIEEINQIAESWKKATEALIANQKAEALRLQIKATSGTPCYRVGSAKYVGDKRFVCTKQNKKLVWR
jgi:hypothetical protein